MSEPSDREGSDREVYRDMLQLAAIVVTMIAAPIVVIAILV